MCDTVCVFHDHGTFFGKNSDRPVGEVQVVEAHRARAPGAGLRTQYLTIPDTGSGALVGSRPTWLWGFEHGVNEHRVAIGNERVFTTLDPNAEPAALIGMDLVRLALERGTTASGAVDVLTDLLERFGQGGVADATTGEPYFSSFLAADPTSAWVVETSGRSWAAKAVGDGGAAISNRLALADDWTRSSADVLTGTRFDERIDPASWPAASDRRLECTLPAVTGFVPYRRPARPRRPVAPSRNATVGPARRRPRRRAITAREARTERRGLQCLHARARPDGDGGLDDLRAACGPRRTGARVGGAR